MRASFFGTAVVFCALNGLGSLARASSCEGVFRVASSATVVVAHSVKAAVQVSAFIARVAVGPVRVPIANPLQKPVAVSPALLAELDRLSRSPYQPEAAPTRFSALEEQLLEAVPVGHELRIVFTSERSRHRLIIRRSADGLWSSSDRKFPVADERTGLSRLLPQDYSARGEQHHLHYTARPFFGAGSEGIMSLRGNLRHVRDGLINDSMTELMRFEQASRGPRPITSGMEALDKAAARFGRPIAIDELWLQRLGLRFDLGTGISSGARHLEYDEMMLMATIRYLIENQLVFIPRALATARQQGGIYHQGEFQPEGTAFPVAVDYANELFAAMQRAGFSYFRGQWHQRVSISDAQHEADIAKVRNAFGSTGGL